MMTYAQVVEPSVNVITNSPSQDYTHPDDHTSPTYDTTPGFKLFTVFCFVTSLCFHWQSSLWTWIGHVAH